METTVPPSTSPMVPYTAMSGAPESRYKGPFLVEFLYVGPGKTGDVPVNLAWPDAVKEKIDIGSALLKGPLYIPDGWILTIGNGGENYKVSVISGRVPTVAYNPEQT